ncbi:MAG: DsrE family protein [Bernardetiaceae bacterium]|jgi:intracellular sulfur oxidation DsrE/DsrF family protein|nr:DsrE family protein [Bernardetiaceae bacterium]
MFVVGIRLLFLMITMGRLATGAWAQASQPEPVFPRVPTYGEAYPIPESVENPDPALDYHVVIDIKTNDAPAEANQSLLRVARLANLLEMSGVPRTKVKLVCVLHHAAAFITLQSDAYRAKFNVDNPNAPIFEELTKAGVRFFICGQSMRARGIAQPQLATEVKVALSAITLITTYQLKGYALLPL